MHENSRRMRGTGDKNDMTNGKNLTAKMGGGGESKKLGQQILMRLIDAHKPLLTAMLIRINTRQTCRIEKC